MPSVVTRVTESRTRNQVASSYLAISLFTHTTTFSDSLTVKMSVSDRGYTLLLTHLHNPTSTLPLPTIQGALAHHLATLSPLPTPLAATAISSPFFLSQPLTHTKLTSLSTAFRHATHLKFRALRDANKSRSGFSSLFRKTLNGAVGQWVTDVVKGVQGGHPVLRLACCSGLLLGVEDLKQSDHLEVGRCGLENETVVSLAEVMDTYAFGVTSGTPTGVEEWEREFQPAGQGKLPSLPGITCFNNMPRRSFIGFNSRISIITSSIPSETQGSSPTCPCSRSHLNHLCHLQVRHFPILHLPVNISYARTTCSHIIFIASCSNTTVNVFLPAYRLDSLHFSVHSQHPRTPARLSHI